MNWKNGSWLGGRPGRTAVYSLALIFVACIMLINLFIFRDSPAGELRHAFFYGLVIILLLEVGLYQRQQLRQYLRRTVQAKELVDLQLRQQQTALEAAANAIVMTDREGEIIWVNPAFTRLTGYTSAEAVGQTPRLLNSGRHDDAFFADLWNTILAGEIWEGETTNRRKDGRLYVEEQTIAPVRDARGEITHFISIKQDVTARKRAYEAEQDQRVLAEVLRDAGTALSATLDFDVLLDKLLVLVRRLVPYDAANLVLIDGDQATICRVRGYEEMDPEFLGQLDQIAFQVAQTRNLHQIVTTQKPMLIRDVQREPEWQHHKSSARLRSWLGIPVIQEGEVVALFCLESMEVDFYQQKQVELLVTFAAQASLAMQNAGLYTEAQQQAEALDELNAELEERVARRTRALAEANEQLKQLDQLKTKFISDVSHELRTPITNLSIYIDLLEKGKREKRDRYVAVLKKEVARLRGLVENILQLSRLDMSKLSPSDFTVFAINDIVEQVVAVRVSLAEAAGLQLDVDLAPDLPQLQGNVSQVEQAIDHLLTNALNYTPEGSVKLRTYCRDGVVGVEVADSGIGIDAEDLPHIFDRFYRGRRTGSSNIPGTGLGLGIVQEIARIHRGSVKVDSTPGRGSTFVLEIPIDF